MKTFEGFDRESKEINGAALVLAWPLHAEPSPTELAATRKAAEQGEARAQYNLGAMYAKGDGVPKDSQQAYFWWLLSSAQGHMFAAKNRDLVAERLTPARRAEAQAQARDWKPK